jgi:hypothetical protein
MDKIKLTSKNLILCEGNDALYFLIQYINILKINNIFQIINYGGISQLNVILELIQTLDHFDELISVSVIRDAEIDYKRAIQSIQNSFDVNNFNKPSKPFELKIGSEIKNKENNYYISTGFLLFPICNDNPQNGTLEDLCLFVLANQDKNKDLLNKINNIILELNFKRPHKNKLYTYFSLTDEYVSFKIGEAAQAKAFNFDTIEALYLKKYLLNIIELNNNK